MANPQAENGHIDIANELAEAFAKTQLSGHESRVLWALLRKTYGWHKKEDWISLSQFVSMTNLIKPRICEAITSLVERGIITKKRNSKNILYSFQKDYDKWKKLRKSVIITQRRDSNYGKTELPLRESVDTKETNTKDTITKEKSNVPFPFNEIWAKYPSKIGKKQAEKLFKASVKDKKDWENINMALDNYLKSERVKRGLIQNGSKWFNDWRDWIDYGEPAMSSWGRKL